MIAYARLEPISWEKRQTFVRFSEKQYFEYKLSHKLFARLNIAILLNTPTLFLIWHTFPRNDGKCDV